MKSKTTAAKKRGQPQTVSNYARPPLEVLAKLGSLAVHIEEFLDNIPGGAVSLYEDARFDVADMRRLLEDKAVQEWRASMDALALLPKKRTCQPRS